MAFELPGGLPGGLVVVVPPEAWDSKVGSSVAIRDLGLYNNAGNLSTGGLVLRPNGYGVGLRTQR